MKPKEFNDADVIRKLELAFSFDCTVDEACLFAGISKSKYKYLIDKDEERKDPYHAEHKLYLNLKDRFQQLRQKPILKARETVVKNLDNVETAKWYLERKAKSEFSTRNEITGADGEGIVIKLPPLEGEN